MPIIADQTVLINIVWSAMIGIDLYWATFRSTLEIWLHIEPQWLALKIDPSCPEPNLTCMSYRRHDRKYIFLLNIPYRKMITSIMIPYSWHLLNIKKLLLISEVRHHKHTSYLEDTICDLLMSCLQSIWMFVRSHMTFQAWEDCKIVS